MASKSYNNALTSFKYLIFVWQSALIEIIYEIFVTIFSKFPEFRRALTYVIGGKFWDTFGGDSASGGVSVGVGRGWFFLEAFEEFYGLGAEG